MNITGRETRSAAFDEKATNAILCFGPDNSQVRQASIGNPHFGAIEDVGITISTCSGTHAAGVTTRIRFGQAKAANNFTFRHFWKPVLFLLLRAKNRDGEHDK